VTRLADDPCADNVHCGKPRALFKVDRSEGVKVLERQFCGICSRLGSSGRTGKRIKSVSPRLTRRRVVQGDAEYSWPRGVLTSG
jgi:hypothetical protein